VHGKVLHWNFDNRLMATLFRRNSTAFRGVEELLFAVEWKGAYGAYATLPGGALSTLRGMFLPVRQPII
jgi:hypothetical protein